MAAGVRLGVDVGTVRVGVASCDPGGILATPLTTLRRDRHAGSDLDALALLVSEHDVVEVVVGLPRHLSGAQGASAEDARAYAAALAQRISVPVRLVDERLSTVSAQRSLRASGVSARKQRAVVDTAAAVVILQSALDEARS